MRKVLASKLSCSVKRISKKYESTGYKGKTQYIQEVSRDHRDWKARQEKLALLEKRFSSSVAHLKLTQATKSRHSTIASARSSSFGTMGRFENLQQHELVAARLRDPLMANSNSTTSFSSRHLLPENEKQLGGQLLPQRNAATPMPCISGRLLPERNGQYFLDHLVHADVADSSSQPARTAQWSHSIQPGEVGRVETQPPNLLFDHLRTQEYNGVSEARMSSILACPAVANVHNLYRNQSGQSDSQMTNLLLLNQLRHHEGAFAPPSLGNPLTSEVIRSADGTAMAQLIRGEANSQCFRQGTGAVPIRAIAPSPLLRHESGNSVLPSLWRHERRNAPSAAQSLSSAAWRASLMRGALATAPHPTPMRLQNPSVSAMLDTSIQSLFSSQSHVAPSNVGARLACASRRNQAIRDVAVGLPSPTIDDKK